MSKTFEVNLYKGSATDVYGNTISIANTKPFVKSEKGYATDSDFIKYTNPILPATGAYTLVAIVRGGTNKAQTIIRPDTGIIGRIYSNYTPATNKALAYLGTNNLRYFNYTPDDAWHLYIYTIPGSADADINNTNLYVDGIQQSVWTTIATGSQNRNANCIAGNSGSSCQNLSYVSVYNEVIPQAEINRLAKWFYSLKQTVLPNRFVYPVATDYAYLKTAGLFMAYNMKTNNNVLVDISNSGNNIYPLSVYTGGIYQDNDGLHILNQNLSLAIQPIKDAYEIHMRVKFDNNGTAMGLWSHYAFNSRGIRLLKSSANQLTLQVHGVGGTSQSLTYTKSTLLAGKYYNISCQVTKDAGNAVISVDGVEQTFAHNGYVTTGGTPQPQIFDKGGIGALTGTCIELLVYSVINPYGIRSFHNKYAMKPVYYNDFSDCSADGIAKYYFSEKFIPVSGTFKVVESPADGSLIKKGEKYVECVTAGKFALSSRLAYGTWEFDWMKGADTNITSVGFCLPTMQSYFGYALNVYSDGSIRVYKNGSVTGMFYTNASYIQNNVWYRCRVTRNGDGTFTVYIKGGNFVADGSPDGFTKVGNLAGGTNPVTENTYKYSNYIVFDGMPGDRLKNMKAWDSIYIN